MTAKERKMRFAEVWLKYEAEAKEAEIHAKEAKKNDMKAEYDFWMVNYEWSKERADHFFNEYMNA